MKFIYLLIEGIALGAGAILPGISSGVLCVIFGIYDKLINSVLEFFNDVKKNIKFLTPILIGIGIGVILFGNILRTIFELCPIQTKFTFMGLIIGCIPSLITTANKKDGFRLHYLLYSFITLSIAITLLIIQNNLVIQESSMNYNFLFLVLSGFIMSIGIVVPGVSSTVLLMILGIYNTYLEAVSYLDMQILFPMGIGVLLGGLVFLKLIKFCFNYHYSQTYYSIIGFVIGSILILYPGISFNFTGITGIICFIFGAYIGKLF